MGRLGAEPRTLEPRVRCCNQTELPDSGAIRRGYLGYARIPYSDLEGALSPSLARGCQIQAAHIGRLFLLLPVRSLKPVAQRA